EGTTPEAHATIHLATVDGRVLHVDTPTTETSAGATWRWNAGLHFGDFGGPTLRVLFLALALATCATFLTGNWIWLARRQARAQSVGNRILARLTVGFGMGTLVAVALVVLASRLFPLEWTARATAEELTFFGALAACIAWAFAARNEARLWWQGLALAGSALLPVPLLATRWSEAGLFGSGPHIAAVVGVDVGFLVAAFALLASALALRTAFARNGGKRDAIRVTVKPDAAQEASIAPGLTLARAEHNALEGS
ncbi:MAG TPA: PepSY-associated TM helix domain-containing protein, partial [Polyangiaceae bacterium]|nr:PepSY-associated TM helix domain-containing protein [Polyangiaceae bacterium]